jgi:hypothetical protein
MLGGAAVPSPGHAASLWLSDTGELLSATRTGQDWLERLRTPEMPGCADAVLTGLAVQVATNMARSGPGRPPRPGSVRARGSQGEWIILRRPGDYGAMFWLMWNRLPGSYARLT